MLRTCKHLYDKQTVVEDIPNYNDSGHVARCLGDGDGYYSVIYLDKHIYKQPIYTEIQDRVVADFTSKVPNHVLILGGGGCAMSRFFLLEYPDCEVTTIEISNEIINLANRYFLADLTPSEIERHHLMEEDAFEFVREALDSQYDFVFVDIFKGLVLDERIFAAWFSREVARVISADAIIAYNISLHYDKEKLTRNHILQDLQQVFYNKTIEIHQGEMYNFIYMTPKRIFEK